MTEPLRGIAPDVVLFLLNIFLIFLSLVVFAFLIFAFIAVLIEAAFFLTGKKSWLLTKEDKSASQGFKALWAVVQARWLLGLITAITFYVIRELPLTGDEQKLLFASLCILIGVLSAFTNSSLDTAISFKGLEAGARIFWCFFLVFDFVLFLMPFTGDSGLWLRPRVDAVLGLFFPVLFGHTLREIFLRER